MKQPSNSVLCQVEDVGHAIAMLRLFFQPKEGSEDLVYGSQQICEGMCRSIAEGSNATKRLAGQFASLCKDVSLSEEMQPDIGMVWTLSCKEMSISLATGGHKSILMLLGNYKTEGRRAVQVLAGKIANPSAYKVDVCKRVGRTQRLPVLKAI